MTNEDQGRLPAGIYWQFFEEAADPIFVLGQAGTFIEINRAACDHLGYSRAELLRMRPEDIDDDASREKVPERIAQLKREKKMTFEAVHVHRNGRHIPVEMHIRLVEYGGEAFLLNICRNVAERKQRELEYQTIIQTATDGFWIVRASDARILEANAAFCKMVGYTRDELLSMSVPDLEANETPEDTKAHILKVMETGHDFFETRHRNKNGHIVDVEVSASYSSLRGGVFFSFMRDISERKRMESELHDSEEKFRIVYENSPIGIAMAGEDRKILLANPACCKLFGYTPEELRQLTISDLTHPDCLWQSWVDVSTLLSGAIPAYSSERKYLKKGGGTFLGQIIATEVTSSTSGKRYIMGLVEDITKRVEQEKRRLDEVREQKDVLVREVHHRIKNNLQGVIGLLRQYEADHPEIAGVIDGIIGKIYAIAAIHGLQTQKLSEAVNLGSLMEQIVGSSEYPVRLSNELAYPIALNKDEAVPVALILNELVTNACKHQPLRCSHPTTVNLRSNEAGVVITITNPVDGNGGGAAGQGSGLHLIKSLLPGKSASLELKQEGEVFSAQLELSPPVVMPEKLAHQKVIA